MPDTVADVADIMHVDITLTTSPPIPPSPNPPHSWVTLNGRRYPIASKVSCCLVMYAVALLPPIVSTCLGPGFRHGPPLVTAARYGYFATAMLWTGFGVAVEGWGGEMKGWRVGGLCVAVMAVGWGGVDRVRLGMKAWTNDLEQHKWAMEGVGVGVRTMSMSSAGVVRATLRGRVPSMGEESKRMAELMETAAGWEMREAELCGEEGGGRMKTYHEKEAAAWYGKSAMFWQREEEWGKAAEGYLRARGVVGRKSESEDLARWTGGLATVLWRCGCECGGEEWGGTEGGGCGETVRKLFVEAKETDNNFVENEVARRVLWRGESGGV